MGKTTYSKVGVRKMKKLFVKQIEGDMLTPIGIFQSLKGRKKCLLESSLKHEQHGRFSFIGCNPHIELLSDRGNNTIRQPAGESCKEGLFLDVLKEYIEREDIQEGNRFPFIGGGVGYIGYDVIRQYEDIGGCLADDVNMPDAHMLFYQDIIVYDHIRQQVYIVSSGDAQEEAEFKERAAAIMKELSAGMLQAEETAGHGRKISFQSHRTQAEFTAIVEKAKEAIFRGDIFQIVLSLRFSTEFGGDSFSFYRRLRRHNPSPYMFYIDFEEYQIVGASPESLIKGSADTVLTNPIAGTRKRGLTEAEDTVLEEELLKDEKELAEHMMLVDLGRNDLGRVCEIGSVELVKYMLVEKYAHVMHIVSEVKGKKRPSIFNEDVLASCLPAGTVSGAPKIRAMNLINQLETEKRNVYAGAVGYFSHNGDFDFALAIRTMVVKEGKAYIQAGAGIVHDSDPQAEYEEVLNKAKALMEVEL
ncbi:anthranilate synthase component I [Bacillus sp. 1P06AnD]|uniref:anthranilate synthase component I n=1 Tax=Bacillus sp. 1P06AnD TaxID=3132208 RepID=UPI0039A36DDB